MKGDTERLRLLSRLAREFSEATGDYDRLLALIARRICESLGDMCVIRALDDDGVMPEAGIVHHRAPEIVEWVRALMASRPPAIGQGVPGDAARSGRAMLVAKTTPEEYAASASPEYRELILRLRVGSVIAAPLRCRGETIGLVSLLRSEDAPPFGDVDLHLVESLAEHAALAISNARAYAAEREAHAAAVRANEALARSNAAHRLLFDASPQPLLVFDVSTLEILAANEAALRLFGYERDEFLRTRMSDLARDDHEAVKTRTARLGDAEAFRTRRYFRKDGTPVVVEFTSRVLTFEGRAARITVIKDITERFESEQTRALLAAIVQSSNDSMVSVRLDGTISSWNAAAERLFGYEADEALGRPYDLIVPVARREEELARTRRVIEGEVAAEYETSRVRKDGREVPVSVSIAPLLDSAGHVVGLSRTARDLTAQRKAEHMLQRTEEQLRQAQKMEAVGRLAGGIAHDFNNMLSVILSYCAMVTDELPADSPIAGDLEEIRRAGVRAADLTRQLLVFSRQQVVEPKALDLNVVLSGMRKMLERLVGEDVAVTVRGTPDLASIRADPSNVEQVIMNLVVNARDAMPAGGALTIETANVDLDADHAVEHVGTTPGPHVMLAVTDTGVGMDRATQARIFEPFFTTKGPGKGTGLGLSTVFGIVQQCGGSVWVESEPGKGTTFKVYFPKVDVKSDPPATEAHPVAHPGQETVLLVEDEAQVRAVAMGILKRSGYRVLVAETPAGALGLCREHDGSIDLLLTDVVMPQMSGAELAREAGELRPSMRVLFMSGYTDDHAVRQRVLESGLALLQKPFTPESLTRRVRDVLSGRAPGSRP